MVRKRFVVILWLLSVLLAAKFIPTWRVVDVYDDLIPESAKQVLTQQAALKIDVFALPDSAAAALVDNFLKPILSHLTHYEINYIDINENPELVSSHHITKQGELIVHQGDKHFQLTTLSYEAFFNGLKRLSQAAHQWVVILDGIGGKSFAPNDVSGYSNWLSALKKANYKVVVLSWQEGLKLPNDAKVLILPSPHNVLTDKQINWIETQILKDINIWWLTDPSSGKKQPALSLLFDVLSTDSYHQGHLIIKDLPDHDINQDFDRPLDLVEVMPYETSQQPLWLNEENQVLASTQEINNSRLLVTGDSDFLSNAFLNSGGNLEMSYRLLDWLLHQQQRIDLPSIGLHQTQLHYSKKEILIFASIMMVILPMLFILISLFYWRRNK